MNQHTPTYITVYIDILTIKQTMAHPLLHNGSTPAAEKNGPAETRTLWENAMFANGFQNMLMIKTGTEGLVANMGKTVGTGSKGLENDFSSVLGALMGKADRSHNLSQDAQALAEKNITALMAMDGAPGQKAKDVIAALAAALSGQATSNASGLFVDSKGLDALGNILEQAGFDPEKVKAFITEKKENMGNGNSTGLPLQSLLTSLGDFMEENDKGEHLDISALPFIQSTLNNFGLEPGKVESILESSTDKDNGVDVEKLFAALAPYTAQTGNGMAISADGPAAPRVKGDVLFSSSPTVKSVDSTATASSVDDLAVKLARILSMASAAPSVNDAAVAEVLDQGAKGGLTIDQFAAKLESMMEPGKGDTETQRVKENFANAFGESVHGVKRGVMTEGSQTFTTLETVDLQTSELRFDTKNTQPALFTEKAQGIFQGNMKGANEPDSWLAAQKTAEAAPQASGVEKKQAALNEGLFSKDQNGDAAATSGKSEVDGEFHLIKAVKGKTVTTQDSGETSHLSVKAMTGAGVYGKTAEMTQVSPSDKTLPAYVTDQVARQISKAVRNGDSEIRFHIKPPDMGRVELSIASTANGLKISILTEHGATRDMLMNQATDLKAILADQGIRIEKMDVGLSGNFGQNMAQTRHDSDQSGKDRKQKDKMLFTMDSISEPRENPMKTMMTAGRATRGQLDLVA
jgi:flagellar hook-length control protein FliK